MKEELVNKLLKYLMTEKYFNIEDLKRDYSIKRRVLRGVINERQPLPISEDILKLEDKLLQEELKEKELIDVNSFKEQITLYQGDITTIKCDAIVNAGNEYLLGCFVPNHSCIDNQIHTYAGIRLRLKCNEIMQGSTLHNGEVVLTDGYNLPCKYVIHTVGPQVRNNITKENEKDLKKCYLNSLELAKKNNIRSIVFPCISTGFFGYPNKEAAILAFNTVNEYLKDNSKYFDHIVFNVFKDLDKEIYNKIKEDYNG